LSFLLGGLQRNFNDLQREYVEGGKKDKNLKEAAMEIKRSFDHQHNRYLQLSGKVEEPLSKKKAKQKVRKQRVNILAAEPLGEDAEQFKKVSGPSSYPGVELWELNANSANLPVWKVPKDADFKSIQAAVANAQPLTLFKAIDQDSYSAASIYYRYMMTQIRLKTLIPSSADAEALTALSHKELYKYGPSYAIANAQEGVFIWNSSTTNMVWLPKERGVLSSAKTVQKPTRSRDNMKNAQDFVLGQFDGEEIQAGRKTRKKINVASLRGRKT